MIDITLEPKVLSPFIQHIVDKILIPSIDEVLAKHHAGSADPLLTCEMDFYTALRKNPKALLEKNPPELESVFDIWLSIHEEYLVLASGSLEKFQRHLPGPVGASYQAEWLKHKTTIKAKGGAKSCKCHFCKVSARSAKVFNWSRFIAKNQSNRSTAADFVRAIGFVVCPYCSRNYISPIHDTGGDIYRPDLDHYLARSIYPYFGLCPYNLVPSCAACNCRIKRDVDFLKTGYFHPYADTVPDRLFSLDGKPLYTGAKIDANSVRIKLNTTCKKTKKSAQFFKLATAYGIHAAEIANFVATLKNFPDRLIEERAKELKADPATLKLMLHRSIAQDKSDFKARPLGKLYRDLYLFGRKQTGK